MARFKVSTCAKRTGTSSRLFAAQHVFGAEGSHAVVACTRSLESDLTEAQAQHRSETHGEERQPEVDRR